MIDKMPDTAIDLLKHAAPVLAGTAVSMFFMKSAWPRRIAQGVIGVPFSIYIAPFVDRMFDSITLPFVGVVPITESEAGVITAVFGLSLVAYAYEVMAQLQIGAVVREWVRKKLGLKEHGKD